MPLAKLEKTSVFRMGLSPGKIVVIISACVVICCHLSVIG